MDEDEREHDCAHDGHDFEFLTALSSPDPLRIVCGACGQQWTVQPV